MRAAKYWDVAAGAVILVGLIQLPGDMLLLQMLKQGGGAGRLGGVLVFVDLVPALPLCLAVLGLMGARIGRSLAFGLTLGSVPLAALLTLAASYDSGGGATIILMEGLALTLAVWGMLWCFAGSIAWGRLLHGVAVLAVLWSLATPVMVMRSALQVAGGAPFCIARHEQDRPIASWAELRGVSFHTDTSGYKDSSAWFLHGVMLVQRNQDIEVWNWSPRAMRFDRIKRPGDLVETPLGVCTPATDFLRGLRVL